MHRSLRFALIVVPSATGCALSSALPSFQATVPISRAPAPPAAIAASLPAAASQRHAAHIRAEHDAATDQTRVSLTTHRGTYFLWIHHPRVTFFYVHSGTRLEHAPATVFLFVRMPWPLAPRANQLSLSCNGVEQPQPGSPMFVLEQGPILTDRVYTFELSLEQFATLATCRSAAVGVGDVTVDRVENKLDEVREFAAGMRSEGEP